jgi:hypothetical protein
MDKDKSQMNHYAFLHHEKKPEDATQHLDSSFSEHELRDQEAEMDKLEARLFAMARPRH